MNKIYTIVFAASVFAGPAFAQGAGAPTNMNGNPAASNTTTGSANTPHNPTVTPQHSEENSLSTSAPGQGVGTAKNGLPIGSPGSGLGSPEQPVDSLNR